jgi:hypothetical protein
MRKKMNPNERFFSRFPVETVKMASIFFAFYIMSDTYRGNLTSLIFRAPLRIFFCSEFAFSIIFDPIFLLLFEWGHLFQPLYL